MQLLGSIVADRLGGAGLGEAAGSARGRTASERQRSGRVQRVQVVPIERQLLL
jgi:hypothetical protein